MSTVNASGNLYIRDNAGIPEYSINNTSWTTITFPLTIVNTDAASSMLVVNFTTNLTLSDTNNNHFKTGSNRIQYGSTTLLPNGTRPVISINNVTNYTGLIENGTSGSNGYFHVYVCNLIVQATGTTTLNSDAAWIGKLNYAKAASNNYIINCSTIGNINNNGGGIVPAFTASNGGNLVIRGCSSSGSIASSAGGIVGYLSAGSSGSVITMENCFTSGSIGINAGGMSGNSCGINGGSIVCINCFSSGTIGSNAGGIFGITTGSVGSATATNCYSTGNISSGGGGIFGANAAFSSGTTTATNCYSTGSIANSSGGIYGSNYTANAFAYNCYTSGASSYGSDGIWAGSSFNNVNGTNNYAEANASSSGWKDSNASVALQNIGTVWLSTAPNTPYIRNNMNSSPYRLDNIDPTNSYNLNTSYTYPLPISVGTSTATADISGFTNFTLVNNTEPTITINSTGKITTTTDTPPATYTLVIYAVGINPYSVSTLILIVEAIPPAPPAQPTLLFATADRYRGNDNELVTIYHVGNTLIADKQQNSRCEFPSYKDYVYYRISAGASFT